MSGGEPTGGLAPCPFCGNRQVRIAGNGIGDFYVICDAEDETAMSCGARSSDYRCETEEHATERWNRRVPSQAPRP